MVEVRFFRDQDNLVEGFLFRGHTESAPHGEDVICAGVSATAQAVLLGLLEVVEADVDFHKEEGYLECRVRQGTGERGVQVLLNTLYLAVQRMADDYPRYLKVQE